MKNIRSVITLIFLALLTVGLFALRGKTRPSSQTTKLNSQLGSFTIGEKAPGFETIDFEGNSIKLSDFEGKAIVLDFWAAWCPFCIEELPELERIHQETKDEVIFLGIHRTDSGESIEKGLKFANDKGVTYTLVQDKSGDIYKMATKGINAMPTAIFIGKDGVVKDIKLGPKTEEEIRQKVNNLLEQNS